jgi:SAM-dependent methyltransferase
MSFAEFLAAKFALDERSLNPAVHAALIKCLRDMADLDCLDVGAGTGATVARMLGWRPLGSWRLTALDRDPALIELACEAARKILAASGHRPSEAHAAVMSAGSGIEVRFAACELAEYRPSGRYDLITAHAFLDLVPLAPTLAAFGRWLRPGSLLYATINCDGAPELAPAYRDEGFESALLACYAESMEKRRVGGIATGGVYCGRRLGALLPAHGFCLVEAGPSDWHIDLAGEACRASDGACLETVLDLIGKEGRISGQFGAIALRRWRAERRRMLRACELEMRVPNTDVLARYTGDAPEGMHAVPAGD